MKLISVIWKLISSKSKLTSALVLHVDNLLNDFVAVADKGGVLVLKIEIWNGEVVVSNTIEKPQTPEEKEADLFSLIAKNPAVLKKVADELIAKVSAKKPAASATPAPKKPAAKKPAGPATK